MNMFTSQQSHSAVISTEILDDVVRITFEGALVYEIIESVKAKLERVPHHAKEYIFEMKDVVHIDSTGFGVIVNLAKRLIKNDTKIVFVVEDEIIKELFNISQLNKVFPIVGSINEVEKVMKETPLTKINFENYLNLTVSNRGKLSLTI